MQKSPEEKKTGDKYKGEKKRVSVLVHAVGYLMKQ